MYVLMVGLALSFGGRTFGVSDEITALREEEEQNSRNRRRERREQREQQNREREVQRRGSDAFLGGSNASRRGSIHGSGHGSHGSGGRPNNSNGSIGHGSGGIRAIENNDDLPAIAPIGQRETGRETGPETDEAGIESDDQQQLLDGTNSPYIEGNHNMDNQEDGSSSAAESAHDPHGNLSGSEGGHSSIRSFYEQNTDRATARRMLADGSLVLEEDASMWRNPFKSWWFMNYAFRSCCYIYTHIFYTLL